ncbi:hypothetical protein BD289DRAFT_443591 [Coniella lustricola]|uniref:DUF4048 domain-containing protein n=1 Tax=Coniella lustricola TaxID=2025994 RepID=A0A2T2ZWU6_9PEZI|nr:hypothetical protein BD289DRAFT_443591 [Coniella lustricola]
MAEDFKAGLWTFVEDLRQVAVGDEPITGAPSGHRRVSGRQSESDRDTIRASAGAARPSVTTVFGGSSDNAAAAKEADPAALGRAPPRRTNSTKRAKHFSWTPLSVDAFDDADWSNWENPHPAPSHPVASPSPRWSATTTNGDVMTTAIPESTNGDDHDAL